MKFPSIHFPVKTIVNSFYHTCEQKTQKILAVRDAYHRILLDAVDTRPDQSGQCVLSEHVGGDPGARGVGGIDGGAQHVVRPQGGQIPHRAINPVSDHFDPAVRAQGLLGQRVG